MKLGSRKIPDARIARDGTHEFARHAPRAALAARPTRLAIARDMLYLRPWWRSLLIPALAKR